MPSNINYKVFSAQQHGHQRQHQFWDPRRCQSQHVCQLRRAELCANITLQILSNIQFMHPQIPRTGWWPTRKMEENARKIPAGAGLGGNIQQTCAEWRLQGIYKRLSQMTKANGQLLFNNMRKAPFYKEKLLVVAFSSVSCFRFPHRTSPTCLLIQLGLYPSPGRGGVCAGCGSADSMVRRKVITLDPAQPSPAFISCARVRTQ